MTLNPFDDDGMPESAPDYIPPPFADEISSATDDFHGTSQRPPLTNEISTSAMSWFLRKSQYKANGSMEMLKNAVVSIFSLDSTALVVIFSFAVLMFAAGYGLASGSYLAAVTSGHQSKTTAAFPSRVVSPSQGADRPPTDSSPPTTQTSILLDAATKMKQTVVVELFVQTWAYGFCSNNWNTPCASSSVRGTWVVHGVWPVDNNGLTVEYCAGPPSTDWTARKLIVDYGTVIQDFEGIGLAWTEMWVGLTRKSNIYSQIPFWNHEYYKHGTCSPRTPRNYATGISSASRLYNAGSILRRAGITTGVYTKKRILDAFRTLPVFEESAHPVLLDCFVRDGLHYLQEVLLCIHSWESTRAEGVECEWTVHHGRDNCNEGNIHILDMVDRQVPAGAYEGL